MGLLAGPAGPGPVSIRQVLTIIRGGHATRSGLHLGRNLWTSSLADHNKPAKPRQTLQPGRPTPPTRTPSPRRRAGYPPGRRPLALGMAPLPPELQAQRAVSGLGLARSLQPQESHPMTGF